MNTPTPIALQCQGCNIDIAESDKYNHGHHCQRRDLARTNTLDCSKCEPVEVVFVVVPRKN